MFTLGLQCLMKAAVPWCRNQKQLISAHQKTFARFLMKRNAVRVKEENIMSRDHENADCNYIDCVSLFLTRLNEK